MKDLIAIFKAETEEHLTKLDNGLVELEKQPDNLELASSLNREVHTLKGAARVFGFYEIQDIAHRIEDIFEEVAGKRAVFNSSMAEPIFKALDAIRAILLKIVQEKKIDAEVDVDASDICRELEECISAAQAIRTRKKREREPKREKEASETQAKGEPEKGDPQREQEVRKPPEKVLDRASETVAPHLSGPTEEYIRVPTSRVDKLLYLVGEVVINKMKASAMSAQAKRLSKLSREAQKSILSLSEAVKKESSSPNREVTRWLSQCEAQMQRLRERTLELYDQVSTEAFHLDPVIDELQAKIKEIKMLPLSTIFEGFPRMIRDIASQQGKQVNLVISGEENELDKKVMEGIKTSLIHILRNCIDHGIEEPEARVALGKSSDGTIKISASHEGDNVVITVEDDGRGMDITQIKETALKKRLVSNHDLEGMLHKEVMNIVFMNGYSTSPIVTDVSGRGMGLDIVRRDIANLKGRVILDTEKNRGTKFTLVLPLTIAIIQVLLVKVQNMLFALPIFSVTESVKVSRDDVSLTGGRIAIQFREHIVPLVKLNEVLRLPPPGNEEEKAKKEMLVVMATSLDSQVGFIVDEIAGEEEAFIKSLGKHLGKVKNVSGAIIMPTGEVVVVLDIADLVANSALGLPHFTGKRSVVGTKHKEKRILVVEDAFSTRELEKSILETHGYLVDTAVDGLDALDRMVDNQYDLIVSDVEMPRMDGFELCRTLKNNEGYKDIPVVMVTALQKEEDKRRGIEVGAAAYLVKSAFEQTNLLDTIERLVD
ncbi:MAG TPA: hybrid sensor histidine kinase/response regulator [Thermodesulfobacteriota bacterium]|nr:hybrid sensor histidine kinase/response regulator [Thermodesulfobacteriota bacterium]